MKIPNTRRSFTEYILQDSGLNFIIYLKTYEQFLLIFFFVLVVVAMSETVHLMLEVQLAASYLQIFSHLS